MLPIFKVVLLVMAFHNAYGDADISKRQFGGGGFGGFGGFGGGYNGFGCSSYLPTVGYECYQPETGKGTVVCVCKYMSTVIDSTLYP